MIINNADGSLRYRAVGALVTDNTTALAVLASSKYTRPAQLSGKIYGGFGIASDKPLVTAILRADGVRHPVFRRSCWTPDVITALAAHRIDYTAVFGGIDDVTARLQGIDLRLFPYNRYLGAAGNYPNAVFVASDRDIAARGPILARALKALAEGYEYAAHDPAAAEAILIRDNETALANADEDHRRDRERDRAALPRPRRRLGAGDRRRLRGPRADPRRRPPDHDLPADERALHERAAAVDAMSAGLRRLARAAWPPAAVLALFVLAWDLTANAAHASRSLPGPWLVVTATLARPRRPRPGDVGDDGGGGARHRRSRSCARSSSRSRSTGRAASAAASTRWWSSRRRSR